MIYKGIIQYSLKQFFPKVEDTLLYGYTEDQLNWCKNNENQMWTYLLEHKLLFNTEPLNIKKLVEVAPYTSMFTEEAPGRAVVFLGTQIVEKYMSKHPKTKLVDLLQTKDYYKLLSASKYNP